MKNGKKLKEGALLLVLFFPILLAALYIPIFGWIMHLFLALPFIIFSSKNDRQSTIIFLIGAFLLSLFTGSVMGIAFTFIYGLTGIVIGDFVRQKKSQEASFIAGSLVYLITLVIYYASAVYFFKFNFIKEILSFYNDSVKESLQYFKSDSLMEQFQASMKMFESLTPSILVLTSLLAVLLIQMVSFPILRKLGIEVSKRKPFRKITLPKSILWYYLGILLIMLIVNFEVENYWYSVVVNVSFILQFLITIQGFSFIFFYSYEKKWPKSIPVLTVIFTLLIPLTLYLVRILGIIDLGFDLRERIVRKK